MSRLASRPQLARPRDDAPGGAAPTGASGADAEAAGARGSAPMLPVIAACLALSALTLLFPSAPTYDPWAWIMWGREIVHLDLVTTGGPSWKPLPVLFTTPFALLGADVAPYLWIWIARAGALLALAMSFRLAHRLTGGGIAGAVAGVFAALFLATTFEYIRDAALGNSEALLAGLGLWAFERHLDGRRDHALYLAVAAALLRPEAWPFLGLYGLWLWLREPRLRLRMVGFAALIPALWFGPELWGSGDALRASSRANNPNPGSAAYAAHPGLEVIERFHRRTVWALEVAGLAGLAAAAIAWARARAQGAILFLAGIGLAWLALVAAMTEGGYAGNQRYLIVTTAVLCVLGGIGVARALQGLQLAGERWAGGRRAGLAVAVAAFLAGLAIAWPVVEDKADNVAVTLDELRYEASLWHTLDDAIDAAGGRDRLLACGAVYSGPFQTQMVAYELGIHGVDVRALEGTPPPGVAFRTHTIPDGPLVIHVTDDRFRQVAADGRWLVWTAPRADAPGRRCPAAAPGAPRVEPAPTTPALASSR
ncbi:MAG: hypothetical protein WD993_10740 [Thermoleophilaceae bacterium]